MKKPRTLVVLLILLVVASAGGAYWWQREATPRGDGFLRQGTPAEVLAEVRAVADAPVTVVNFWASWCEPCKREFPSFLRLRRELAPRGVRVIFVSVDDGADFEEAEAFLRQNGVDFPSFYKGKQSLNFVAELFPGWSGAVPATLIFGPGGTLLDSWEGDTTWENLRTKVLNHLGGS